MTDGSNVVFLGEGVQVDNGLIENNLIYANTEQGIAVIGNGTGRVEDNRIYDNATGITAGGSNTTLLARNNILIENGLGILLDNGDNHVVEFNTIVETGAADGIVVRSFAQNTLIQNNILSIADGDAISVDENARSSYRRDSGYNLYDLGAGSRVLDWGGVEIFSLVDARLELGLGRGGQIGTPGFVDLDGADDVLGTADDDVRLLLARHLQGFVAVRSLDDGRFRTA